MKQIRKNTEIWLKIKNFPKYSISSSGRVRSDKKNLILKPQVTRLSYLQVRLWNGKKWNGELKYIHRLVASAYIPNYYGLPEVNHLDLNKKNNHHSNLIFSDHRSNCVHYHQLKVNILRMQDIKDKYVA